MKFMRKGQLIMEKIRKFRDKLAKKKLIDGVTREDITLYQEVSKVVDSFVDNQAQEKFSSVDDDIELFVRLVQKKF